MNETQYIKRPGERAPWLELRRPYVGQSEAGIVLGLSPFRSACDLFLEKTGRVTREDTPTEAMLLGIELEGYAARRYMEKTGRTVRNYGYMVVRGHALADVDRLIVKDGEKVASHHEEIRAAGILECKTARDEWDGEVPLHYQVQAQGYCELLDLPFCDFSVVFKNSSTHRCPADPGWEFLRVERDRAIGARIMEKIEEFAACVASDTPPPVTGLADARAIFPNARVDAPVTATAEIVKAVDRLRAIAAQTKELEAEEDALKGTVAEFMGDADTLRLPEADGGAKLCTFKAPKPRRVTDWKGVAADLHAPAELVAAHTTETPSARRFLLCSEKGDAK